MKKLLIFILLSISLTACVGSSKNRKGKTVEDVLGRKVKVPNKVDKVIGLRAGALRLLLYCGAKDIIAGIEEPERRADRPYLSAFSKIKELPLIGPAMGGDAELIMKIKPDVIFLSYTTIADANALEKKTGIPVLAIECSEFATERETLFKSFKLIGKVINKSKHVNSLISYIENSIKELDLRTKKVTDKKKQKVYIGGVPYSGSHGITSTQPFYPPFVFTNTNNIASSISKNLISHVKGTYIDVEQLLQWNPDVIFIDKSGIKHVNKEIEQGTVLYKNLDAVKNNKIFTLFPYNNYAINYEMALVNSWYVASVLYPEQFSDINLSEKVSEILESFFEKEHNFNFTVDYFNKY